jgi:hypothetical protein
MLNEILNNNYPKVEYSITGIVKDTDAFKNPLAGNI